MSPNLFTKQILDYRLKDQHQVNLVKQGKLSSDQVTEIESREEPKAQTIMSPNLFSYQTNLGLQIKTSKSD